MSSAQKTLTSSRISPSSSSLIRSGCTFKTPWASTTMYNIILPEMRRQTLRKPRSSTRHDHRSSTLTDVIQKPKKTLIPAPALLSLSRWYLLHSFKRGYQRRHHGNQNDRRQSSAMKREREGKPPSVRGESSAQIICIGVPTLWWTWNRRHLKEKKTVDRHKKKKKMETNPRSLQSNP